MVGEKFGDDMGEEMYNEEIKTMNRQELLDYYEQMNERASRDKLTGLLNRGEMERLIRLRLRDIKETEGAALFIIDLDNFKKVNDTLGHQPGDDVLTKAAKLLSGMFRATDIVGRLGGDEFVVFLSGALSEEMIHKKAQTICDQIQLVMNHADHIVVTASVGIHLDLGKKHDFERMYRSADRALYRVKQNGKQGYCIASHVEETDEDVVHEPVNAVRLKGLLDYIDSGVAMIEVKKELAFIYVSPAFARMLGREADEMMKMPVFSSVHPEDRRELEHLLRTKVVGMNQPVNHELRIRQTDGRIRWWKLHAVRVEYNEKYPVVLLTGNDITEFKERESDFQQNESMFRTVLGQKRQGIWEVELPTKKFRFMGENYGVKDGKTEEWEFPEDLIQSKTIAWESAEEFREFADELLMGKVQGYGNFLLQKVEERAYQWVSFSYRTIFDESGVPIRAVGVMEGLETEHKEENEPKSMAIPDSMKESLILHMRGNLSKNTVAYLWDEGRERAKKNGCIEILNKEMEKRVLNKKMGESIRALALEDMERAFWDQDKRWFVEEYKRVNGEGEIQWVTATVNLYTDGERGELRIAVWISLLNQRHYWETALGLPIYKDPINKIYTRSTVREMAIQLLEKKRKGLCALVMVEIGGMANLYREGSEKIEKKWRALLAALTVAVGTDCVPGQFGKDRVVFFFPEISDEETLRRKLEQAFLFVRNHTSDYVDGKQIRLLAGGVCMRRDQAVYQVMMKKVQEVCGLWSNTSGDRIAFAADGSEAEWEKLRRLNEVDRVRVPYTEYMQPLSEREKSVAFDCILKMLDSDSLQESARGILKAMGEYYEADRIYILAPVEDERLVVMPHEWTSSQKTSIQQAVSGMQFTNFPLMVRCKKEGKPVFLTRSTKIQDIGKQKEEQQNDMWHFSVFPMWDDQKIDAYLCIENAKSHRTDIALPAFLGGCLMKEKRKYGIYVRNGLTGVGMGGINFPDTNAYVEQVYNFTSDVYTSMGIVCVDVPELAVINKQQGVEYGRRMLWYIVQILSEIFGSTMVFRTWNAEFVAVCPNTTQQTFLGKWNRLYAALVRRYPKGVRTGHSWSDKEFKGKDLIDEARELMRCRNPVEFEQKYSRQEPQEQEIVYDIDGEMTGTGQFVMHMQPVINMQTEVFVGADVIVRGVDEKGKMISRTRFLERLRKDGTVRELELFVFEQTLHFMEQSREKGWNLLPVSVHFSNETMKDGRAFASILAIHSRYPQIPTELIEIELKAEEGVLENVAWRQGVCCLKEMGFRFCLGGVDLEESKLAILEEGIFQTVRLHKKISAEIVGDEECWESVQKLIKLCRIHGADCIAEGVEGIEQEMALTRAGCIYGQGYYYEYPISAETFGRSYLAK